MVNERKEPTVSSVLSSKEDLADRRSSLGSATRASTAENKKSIQHRSTGSKSSSGFVILTFFMTLLALVAAGYLFWQLQLSQQSIAAQQLRIVELENQLTISGDTANQSLASVSVKVNELSQRSVKATSEIDKLWAARNTNVDAIKKVNQRISANVKKRSGEHQSLEKSLSLAEQRTSEQEILIQSLRERVNDQKTAQQKLSSQIKKNTATAANLKSLQSRVKESEEAMASLEAFRRNVNRDILQLKAGAAAVKK